MTHAVSRCKRPGEAVQAFAQQTLPQGGFISPEDVKSNGVSPRVSVGKVTMQEQGISRMLTINLNDVEKELHIK